MSLGSLDLKSTIMLVLVAFVIFMLFRNYFKSRKKIKKLEEWMNQDENHKSGT